MAVAVRFRVAGATRDDHDRLQAAINDRIDATGGPPDGLLVHLAHADGDGFAAVDVVRSVDAWHAFRAEIIEPAAAQVEVEIVFGEPAEVWSLARP